MKLSPKLQEQLKNTSPFIEIPFRGINDMFVIDGESTKFEFEPPSMELLQKNGTISSLITQHSKAVNQKPIVKSFTPQDIIRERDERLKQIQETPAGEKSSETNLIEMATMLLKMGREVVLNHCVSAKFFDPKDNDPVRFIENFDLEVPVISIARLSEDDIFTVTGAYFLNLKEMADAMNLQTDKLVARIPTEGGEMLATDVANFSGQTGQETEQDNNTDRSIYSETFRNPPSGFSLGNRNDS
jgi:hypothetical protein